MQSEGQGLEQQQVYNYVQMQMPLWWKNYSKHMSHFSMKLRSFTYGAPLEAKRIQTVLNTEFMLQFNNIDNRLEVLSLIVMRNVLRLQIFIRAILKMRDSAAKKIQRKI